MSKFNFANSTFKGTVSLGDGTTITLGDSQDNDNKSSKTKYNFTNTTFEGGVVLKGGGQFAPPPLPQRTKKQDSSSTKFNFANVTIHGNANIGDGGIISSSQEGRRTKDAMRKPSKIDRLEKTTSATKVVVNGKTRVLPKHTTLSLCGDGIFADGAPVVFEDEEEE